MKINLKVLGIFLLLFVLIDFYMLISSPIFYSQFKSEPIRIYYGQSGANQSSWHTISGAGGTAISIRNQTFQIDYIEISFIQPFDEFEGIYDMSFHNYTQKIPVWRGYSKGLDFNFTRDEEFKLNQPPDYLIETPYFEKGFNEIWSQNFENNSYSAETHGERVNLKPFLIQTSFDTWEGECFFDTGFAQYPFTSLSFKNDSYYEAETKKVIISLYIKDSYIIEDLGGAKIEKTGDYFFIIKELEPGQLFFLKTKDPRQEYLKYLFSPIIPLMIGVLLGIFYKILYDQLPNKSINISIVDLGIKIKGFIVHFIDKLH